MDEDDTALKVSIARIEERTRSIDDRMKGLSNEFHKYVTQVEFKPVRLIVFGIVGTILAGVLGALLALVVKQ